MPSHSSLAFLRRCTPSGNAGDVAASSAGDAVRHGLIICGYFSKTNKTLQRRKASLPLDEHWKTSDTCPDLPWVIGQLS